MPARVCHPDPPGYATQTCPSVPCPVRVRCSPSLYFFSPSFTPHLTPSSSSINFSLLASSITIKLPNFLSSISPLFLHQKYLKISPSSSSSHSLSYSLFLFHQFLHSVKSPSFHISLFIFNFSPQNTLPQFLLLLFSSSTHQSPKKKEKRKKRECNGMQAGTSSRVCLTTYSSGHRAR